MEQCIYCQSVYELEDSNSTEPTSLCSKECEEGFKKHEEAVAKWVEEMDLEKLKEEARNEPIVKGSLDEYLDSLKD